MDQIKQEQYDIEIVEYPTVTDDQIEIVEASQVVEDSPVESIEVTEDDNQSSVEYTEWSTPDDFEAFVVASARKTPEIFEGSKNSLKRAFHYLENLSEEISNGVAQDAAYSDLSESQLRTLDNIEDGIDSALRDISAAINGKQRIKKVASKSATFHTYINPFIHGLARIIINGKVSQGKDIETLFSSINEKYNLDDREKLQLMFALEDFGHPIRSSYVDSIDYMTNYHA